MMRKIAVAVAASALACVAFAPGAFAAKHHKQAAPAPAAQAETIPGVNPMTNAAATPSGPHAAAPGAHAETIPGVNPMTNAPPTPAVSNPATYDKVPGVNPM
jgi:hypothetical protein